MTQSKSLSISIGILAHNEQDAIERTLLSLFCQSILSKSSCKSFPIENVEIVCVPNGCHDETEQIVIRVFRDTDLPEEVRCRVKTLAQAGKSRAWNEFVHEISMPQADFLILMDADISFASTNVLEMLVSRLLLDQSAIVATDQAIKATKLKSQQSVSDKVSLAASDQAPTENSITGQLYCARASEIRRIWMPLDLPVEDGFLAAMIVTDGFTVPDRSGVISRVPGAAHYYDVHEDVAGFLRHEQRIVVGSVINSWIFSLLWREGQAGHVGSYIKQSNELNPSWVEDLIAREVATRGYWVVPRGFAMKRLRALRSTSLTVFVRRLPVAIFATVLQIVACVLANRTLRQAQASKFW